MQSILVLGRFDFLCDEELEASPATANLDLKLAASFASPDMVANVGSCDSNL